MLQAHEQKLAKLVEQLEEAHVILQRAAHTIEELSKLFRITLNEEWQKDGSEGHPIP